MDTYGLDIINSVTLDTNAASKKYVDDSISIGTSGTSGTSGSSGTSGTSGTSGSSGTSGLGTSGSSGTSGTSGSSGTSGTSGTAGTSGTSGTSGISGIAGTSGTSGSSGSSGTSGSSGSSGVSGTSGTSGSGTSGTSGSSGSSGNVGFVTASNTDIDTGTEVVDSFADNLGDVCFWFCKVMSGANVRASIVMAAWDATGNTMEYTENSTLDVGDTGDLVLTVDINSDTVRLLATAGSDNWIVSAQRALL